MRRRRRSEVRAVESSRRVGSSGGGRLENRVSDMCYGTNPMVMSVGAIAGVGGRKVAGVGGRAVQLLINVAKLLRVHGGCLGVERR